MSGLDTHVRTNKGEMDSVEGGVNIFWLAKHFEMEVSTVRKKLAGCPAVSRKTSGYLYRIKDAAAYLVQPKMDPEAIIRGMKAQDLPPHLQSQFWVAALNRQKWEREAGDLWHTGDVLEAFGEVFKTIKTATQLWPDTVAEMVGLSNEQRRVLQDQTDTLLTEIHTVVKDMARERVTPSVLARLEDLLQRGGTLMEEVAEQGHEDVGLDHLI